MSFRTIDNFTNIYITADLHLSSILNRTIKNRGFSDPEEHNIFIRNLINSTITNKSDILYILGDVGFKNEDDKLINFIKSLTPRIRISLGNHDNEKQLKRLWSLGIIEDFKHDYKIRWNNNIFHFNHLPLLEWEGYYQDALHCFAHCHGKRKPYLRAMDIGLDANNMKILNLQDVVDARKGYNNV